MCWVKLIFKVKYVGEMVSKTYVDVFLIEILILKVMIATGFTCLVAPLHPIIFKVCKKKFVLTFLEINMEING